MSYTRKDGQYLRWDVRSGRGAGSRFHKGEIPDFKTAVLRQLAMMAEDLGRRDGPPLAGRIRVVPGSCLIELMSLADDAFDLVMTSPPYCNRYDYTRTYALELAYMGYDDADVKRLRQSLLSCTVENRGKHDRLRAAYAEKGLEARYRSALEAFSQQAALQEVLRLLYTARGAGSLNNDHIPAMVENYFFEMCLVVRELARVLAPGGHVVMVNDNVQYHGQEIPVDLILSDFAAQAGLEVDCIWVLPRGKGNSSQQMGAFGRRELRKCVYVWSKPALE
ncbi:MAG: site-specific DNA-methyltransferase [Clostridia bacterium]|nr:site-specific DNA-methyltransferase [Clostridia bacterium]